MKISTDAILLGSLSRFPNPSKIMDIGTGTGVLSLMLAQRYPDAEILAIEIDEDAASQALENFEESRFAERLKLWKGRFQDLELEGKLDLVVSNPPYFPDHLKSSDPKRNKALHTDELSFRELLAKVKSLLDPRGNLWVILPPRQMQDFMWEAKQLSIFSWVSIKIKDKEGSKVMREVCGFSFQRREMQEEHLVLKEADGIYTAAYKSLLGGFLLGY